jgi:TolB-like protein/Flp pilus assembly protein TadD
MSEERGVGLKGWLSGPRSKNTKAEARVTQLLQMDTRRIVVLPLANISPDPRDEYFADGLTEELISNISKISELSVISRTSAMSYKGTKRKVSEIGNELDVGSVLEGSVRKTGSRMRIAVELIDAKSDKHLWAETYDREFDDLFSVQSDIAKQVADALRVRILPGETRRIEKKPTTSSEAYGLYIKGRYFWNKRTKEALLKAIELFERAITIDPKFALAYSGIADSYSVLSDHQDLPNLEAQRKEKENALKAVEFDASSAEAHTSLASALSDEYDWDGAQREFRKAIELNPNYATAHQWYGIVLGRVGKHDKALQEVSKAQLLDPLSPQIAVSLGYAYDIMEKYDHAESQARKALELEPNFVNAHSCLNLVYLHQGRYLEAETHVKEILRLTNGLPWMKAWMAAGYAFEGRKEEAKTILAEVKASPPEAYVGAVPIVFAYVGLGEKEEAIKLIEREYETRANWLPLLAWEPLLASIRSDPRVMRVLKKIGFETQHQRDEHPGTPD